MWLRSRVRLKKQGITRQIYAATNPGAPSHFLARIFGLAMEYQPAAGHEAITTSSLDNRFLPADYLETLNSYTGLRHKRFVRGLWVGSDGLVSLAGLLRIVEAVVHNLATATNADDAVYLVV